MDAAAVRGPVAVSLSIIAVLALAIGTLIVRSGPAAVPQALADAPQTGPGEWFDSQRAVGMDALAYARAVDQARQVGAFTAEVAPEVAELEWDHMGPTNFGGRVVDLAIDTDDLNTVYIAAASGGVWTSTDAGVTFEHTWPDDLTQVMGALAIGSDGVLYAGTGESNPGGGSMTYGGTGLYRSSDKGETWELVGLPTSGAFGRIVVDPDDPQRVFAAAVGNQFVPGGERGLYRSLDGGDTWERVLAGPNDTTGAVDVQLDPADPDHLLASLWDRQRHPTHRRYAGEGSGLYRSTDGGDTWERIDAITMDEASDNGRIGLAFAPGDPDRVYAAIFNVAAGGFGDLWRSDDGGDSWDTVSVSSMLRGNLSVFGWWFGRIWVDPADADRLFLAGVELMDSRDGGQTWTPHGSTLAGVVTGAHQVIVHADQHAMAWHPDVPGRVYLGNDGGFYRSDANATPGSWVTPARQGWTQHYSVDVGEQSPDRVVTGLQDNMCQRNYVAETDVGADNTWTKYGLCGDGLETLIHPTDETITYGCAQYGGCGRQRAGVPDPQFRRFPGSPKGWWAPLVFDPNDPSIMYGGSNVVSRSTNGGNSWTQISEVLTGEPEQLDPNPSYRIYGTITSIAVAKTDPNVLLVSTDTGKLWRTEDLGETWTEMDDEALPGLWITKVAIDPTDEHVGYAAYSGYRAGDDAAHVVRTTDGGATWEDISGNLPDAPVNVIEVIGDAVAVGTDVGVYLTDDGGETWLRVGANLPTIPVLDLRYHEATSTLTAATFGHGVQRVTIR